MREDTLPHEFAALQGKVRYVRRVSSTEWSSSCPNCSGDIHKNGEFPDRFRMWTNANGKNRVMGWCRHCSYVWFPQSDRPMSTHEFEQWRKDTIAAEERRKAEAEKALKLLQSEKLWLQFHAGLNEWARSIIHSWGIPQGWADYWRLGMISDYTVFSQGENYHSPAITIPLWQLGKQVPLNIKLRVLNPRNDRDRYRNYYKTGVTGLFATRPDLKSDTCLVVEGEKKAMVASSRLGKDWQVFGIPTKTPNIDTLKILDPYGKIYLCLDPDAEKDKSLERVVEALGKERVLVMRLPDKIDDMVVQNNLQIPNAMKYARPWR